MTTRPITVVLINDYPMVLAGLRSMLAPFATRVVVVGAELGNPAPTDADIALLDTFGVEDVGQRVRELIANRVAGGLVIFSWSSGVAEKEAAAAAGARGYVSKRLSPEQLVSALESIHEGLPHRSGAADAVGTEDERTLAGWPGKEAGLVEREAEVLALITQGLRNEEIASVLYLSINSIKRYIRSAYRKIGVSSRTEALLWALDHGFSRERQSSGTGRLGARPTT